jgi:AcrR family transcriptional regulator
MMSPTDTYHHGDLRRELMDGALAVIATQGLAGLSLRSVAAAAGVSHAAPYHHFADKAALVRALGFRGLRLLDERMAAAQQTAGEDPGERLVAIGVAYVAFAAASPAYFIALSAPEMQEPHDISQDEEHGEPWERLVAATVECQQAGLIAQGDPTEVAIGLWSLVEGLSRLWLGGPLRQFPHASDGVEALASRVVRSMLPLMRPALPAS